VSEGLGGKARNPELEKVLGRIPYLNGGLFEKHPIEERWRSQLRSVSAVQPILAAIEVIAAHSDG